MPSQNRHTENRFMHTFHRLFLFLALFAAAGLLAAPAFAQGKSDQSPGLKKGHQKKVVVQRADDDSDQDDSDTVHTHQHVHRADQDRNALVHADHPDRVVRTSGATSIIALSARITNVDTGAVQTIDFDKGVAHPRVQVGDTLRLELIGTAIVDGNGVPVRVPADFEIAAGSWRLDLQPAPAGNAVIVHATQPNSVYRGNPEGRSGVGYKVRGDYDMKGRLQEGRITFEIADAQGDFGDGTALQQPGTSTQPWKTGSRWDHTVAIGEDLAMIDFEPDGLTDDQLEIIYARGLEGIRSVALELAEEAEDRGMLRGRTNEAALGQAYRYLLGREGSLQAIMGNDPEGFRSNLRHLDNEGYPSLVRQFVDSAEFRRVHDIDAFENMPANANAASSRVVRGSDGRWVVVRDRRN